MSLFKKIPFSERPRERMVRYGGEALSLIELFSILIGTGTREKTVMELATDLLTTFGTLRNLYKASLEELASIKGIGEAKAIQLKAAFSLTDRLQEGTTSRVLLKDPSQIVALIQNELSSKTSEALMVILKDVKGQIFHRQIVAIGTLTEVLLHPREVFFPAIRHKAHSLILAHNHPSGDSRPSLPDIEMTKLLRAAGNTLGIPVKDHLIIGNREYFSFRENGIL